MYVFIVVKVHRNSAADNDAKDKDAWYSNIFVKYVELHVVANLQSWEQSLKIKEK